jgi:protein-S-isoprenylcysteine O-methyltransferase Ste14
LAVITRAFFGLLLIAFPVGLAVKIRAQRREIGRSPIVLGAAAHGAWALWFERLAPAALVFWPATWLWVALGAGPVEEGAAAAIGMLIMAAGAGLSLASIFLMGRAWRIGIDPENRSDLAESGPYRWIRHPIYSGWLTMMIGNIVLVPHPVIVLGALVTTIGVTIQARREEQHLHRVFGDRYRRYAERTGRFAPRLRGPWAG